MSTLSSLLPPIEQPPIEIGDPLPEFAWTNQRNEPVSLYTDSYCGRVTVLFLCRAAGSVATEIAVLRDSFEAIRAFDAQVFVVTTDPVEINQAIFDGMELPFDILSDPALAAGGGIGLRPADDAARRWAVVVLNPNTRVIHVIHGGAGGTAAAAALAFLRSRRSAGKPEIIVSHAPVLIVPNVLEQELCDRLIRFFDASDTYAGGLTNADEGDYFVRPNVKTRQDAAVPTAEPVAQSVFANFRKRVFPEMFKAFRYRVTRAEAMRIGCYIADEGGKFAPHRDDNTPNMRHRRFGFTINLNMGDYDGGYLRFPEYGPQLYAPDTGGMVVFSVSLLHEALPVTSGRRYGLFGFLFGEAEEAWRKQQNPTFESPIVDDPVGSHHVGPGTS